MQIALVSPEQFDDEIITAMVCVMKDVKNFLGTPSELTEKINQHTSKKYIPNVVSQIPLKFADCERIKTQIKNALDYAENVG